MPNTQSAHPTDDQLRSFAQGNLEPIEFAVVAEHVERCEACCSKLADQPENTLVALAREVATLELPAGQGGIQGGAGHPIPPALLNHPRYRIVELVGVGGMGAVYRAEHLFMQRTVALKVVHPWLLKDPHAVDRFEREVRLAAKLSHPNIVVSFDADRADELHFLVMEYVDGQTLNHWIANHPPVAFRIACDWVRQAALGLQHAHELGMVHRDIKPHNLMVTPEGQVRILDFGLSRLVAEQAERPTADQYGSWMKNQTRADVVLGTPDYIAPEQIRQSREADIRADIYSLGCTLYFLLSGRPPFRRTTVRETLNAQLNDSPLPIESLRPDISPQLASVLQKMLAKSVDDRYQRPEEVAQALAAFCEPSNNTPIARSGNPTFDLPRPDASRSLVGSPANTLGKVKAPSFRRRHMPAIAIAGACCILAIAGLSPLVPSSLNPFHSPTRLLVMLPSDGLWYPDYSSLVQSAEERGIKLTFASHANRPARTLNSSIPGVAIPDVRIDEQVLARDYDGLVFIGYDTSEFSPHAPEGADVRRLVNEFQLQRKVLASVCAGQRVLVQHGVLRGKGVAPTQSVTAAEIEAGDAHLLDQSVVVDGQVVTCSKANYAGQLLEAIEKIRNR